RFSRDWSSDVCSSDLERTRRAEQSHGGGDPMTAIRSRSALAEERGYFTVAQVRAAEAELFTRVPEGVPMRRAAHGLARVVAAEQIGSASCRDRVEGTA